jgi:hypothetical protein
MPGVTSLGAASQKEEKDQNQIELHPETIPKAEDMNNAPGAGPHKWTLTPAGGLDRKPLPLPGFDRGRGSP